MCCQPCVDTCAELNVRGLEEVRAADTDPQSSSVDCAICLGTSGGDSPRVLLCAHAFCHECLAQHVEVQLSLRRGVWCPSCRHPMSAEEIAAVCRHAGEALPSGAVLEALLPPTSRAFRRAARRAHLKFCPSCRAMIVKNGGCDSMTCRCGQQFDWAQAESVVRCRRVHLSRRGFPFWCTTCEGCSGVARAKLVAVRVGVVAAAVPACAAVMTLVGSALGLAAAGAATTAALPAILCGPLALAYEPVCRLRGGSRNPFARGMGYGVRLLGKMVG